jgi:hypothetical protein
MAHHNLGSSRETSNRLGGFTSKSNKCHKYYFTKLKCSSAHKDDSLNPSLRFSHKSQDPHKEGLGELTKAYDECILWVAPAASKGGRMKAFILVRQKLVVGN